jgi:hypothetical protein
MSGLPPIHPSPSQERSFAQQINIAGVAVFLTSYFMTEDLKTAAIITGAHALAHLFAGNKTTIQL